MTDFTNNDHSFKNWFSIMWKNGYIVIFFLAIAVLLFALSKAEDIIQDSGIFWLCVVSAIPAAVIIVIAYKAFYQFWKDVMNGRSR